MLAGYNGTPKGLDNNCEYFNENQTLVTKSEVIHAETNAVLKAAREGVSTLGATMYVTLSPCDLAVLCWLTQEFLELVYLMEYRDTKGMNLLKEAGVCVEKFQS